MRLIIERGNDARPVRERSANQAGRRNVGGLGYKREQPETDANAPSWGVRGRSHSPDWKQHMPSRTRTPDLLAPPGQDAPPGPGEPAAPAGPPGPAGSAGAAGSAGSGLRLIAVPDGWPPYDCETHGAACPAADPQAGRQPARLAAAGESALARNAVPAHAEASTRTSTRTSTAAGAVTADRARAAGADQAPGLGNAWPRQFAQVLVEVLTGFRPARQLTPWTTERVRARIDLLSRTVAADRRPRIRRVMTSRPAAGAVEMTMVVSFGSRSRALAMRFEHVPARPPGPGRPARPARWLCTEIETS